MDANQAKDLILTLLFNDWLAADFSQLVSAKLRTTKHDRRVRSFAYILDTLTANNGNYFRYTEQQAISLIGLIESVRAVATSAEAMTALERAEKRLRYALENPTTHLRDKRECHACGEVYSGENHVCTNRSATAKDSVMTHDDTIM